MLHMLCQERPTSQKVNVISAQELLSVNAAISVKRQRPSTIKEIDDLEEEGAEEKEDKEKKAPDETGSDVVDGKELTDFEVIMKIDSLELVYSHFNGKELFLWVSIEITTKNIRIVSW